MHRGQEDNGLGLSKKAKREWVGWANLKFALKSKVFLSF